MPLAVDSPPTTRSGPIRSRVIEPDQIRLTASAEPEELPEETRDGVRRAPSGPPLSARP